MYLRLSPNLGKDDDITTFLEQHTSMYPNEHSKLFFAELAARELRRRELLRTLKLFNKQRDPRDISVRPIHQGELNNITSFTLKVLNPLHLTRQDLDKLEKERNPKIITKR
jgi:hypothetical protein